MDTKRYNGKIYALRSYQTELIYIGSTIEKRLSSRFSKHKYDCKMNLKGKKNYITSYEILKYGDCYIELVEEVLNCTKDELRRIEGSYIREMNCVNKYVAGRFKGEKDYNKEYYVENKDKINARKKLYYNENKEEINEQKKIKYLCECGKELTYGCKARHNKICPNNSKAI